MVEGRWRNLLLHTLSVDGPSFQLHPLPKRDGLLTSKHQINTVN